MCHCLVKLELRLGENLVFFFLSNKFGGQDGLDLIAN
jgi:hypothetical protein